MGDQIFVKLGFTLVTAIVVPIIAYYMLNKLERRDAKALREGKKNLSKILSPKEIENLNPYEVEIASSIVSDQDLLDLSWSDIGGLSTLINDIRQRVIFPFLFFHTLKSKSPLVACPKGVLFYGHPGCGKTIITKAIAKEIGCNIILLEVSSIHDKWYGESEKLVKALFSLAEKIQPCIIFLDEIDSMLRTRNSNDHECTSRLKSIFLTQMDGFLSTKDCRVLIIGATNRIDFLDNAILRRLPEKFYIPLPEKTQRAQILKVILKDIELKDDVNFEEIALFTENYSGSDLKELCKSAVALRIFKSNPHLVTSAPNVTQMKSCDNDPIISFTLQQSDLLEAVTRKS